jgi:hypothetical protein
VLRLGKRLWFGCVERCEGESRQSIQIGVRCRIHRRRSGQWFIEVWNEELVQWICHIGRWPKFGRCCVIISRLTLWGGSRGCTALLLQGCSTEALATTMSEDDDVPNYDIKLCYKQILYLDKYLKTFKYVR